MRKMFFIVLAAAALLLTVTAQNAKAQSSETPKMEIGVQYTLLRLRDFDTTDNGVGTRVTYNLADSFSIEGEFNYFPQSRPNFATNGLSVDSKRSQGLFGVKYGLRSESFGIFSKFRPGFMRFSEGTPLVPGATSDTEFAFDFGGVFEYYPQRAVSFRIDVGDTLIRFSNPVLVADPTFRHNLQIGVGVGFRFK
ncbi:MAG TPA: outer membrane beta-barrel protein [Blastocatellia bacterium]|nr:outer membrane beta-barrel protein [Blastocatellia bacterium]